MPFRLLNIYSTYSTLSPGGLWVVHTLGNSTDGWAWSWMIDMPYLTLTMEAV